MRSSLLRLDDSCDGLRSGGWDGAVKATCRRGSRGLDTEFVPRRHVWERRPRGWFVSWRQGGLRSRMILIERGLTDCEQRADHGDLRWGLAIGGLASGAWHACPCSVHRGALFRSPARLERSCGLGLPSVPDWIAATRLRSCVTESARRARCSRPVHATRRLVRSC